MSRHVKAGVLQAISLAGAALVHARGRATARGRRAAKLEQAENEIALLREELAIKDGRWERSRSRLRPHYTPTQRMRILLLRAARGWTLEKTSRVFLLDLHTLQLWMRRLDEHGERDLIQTVEPVNRYPHFVRNLVRQLKRLFPAMGSQRMAQVLARAGLQLGATTIRRMTREYGGPPGDDAEVAVRRRRRVVARYPGHTFHVDLTTVPTRAGFWVPWFPYSLPQRWPFCWWIAVAVDQVSRALIGFAVFSQPPSSEQIQRFLDRAMQASGYTPKYVITDKGGQFWCRGFKRWCKRRGIRPRYSRRPLRSRCQLRRGSEASARHRVAPRSLTPSAELVSFNATGTCARPCSALSTTSTLTGCRPIPCLIRRWRIRKKRRETGLLNLV